MFKQLLVSAPVVAGLLLAMPSDARAGTCGSVGSVTSDLWQKYGEIAVSIPYVDKVAEMIRFWNEMVGDGKWKIGPRQLQWDTDLNGTITGPSDRVFIAATPSDKGSATIELEKLAGKAKTSVTVCAVDGTGAKTKLWDFTAGKGKYTKTWVKNVSGIKDKIVTVHLHGHSASKKFKYTLKTTK